MARSSPDFIAVLEAAYDLRADEETWVTNVVSTGARLLPPGDGALAMTYNAADDRVGMWRSHGMRDDTMDRMFEPLGVASPEGQRAADFFPPSVWRRMMSPFPRASTLRALFPRRREAFMDGFLKAAGNQMGVRGTDESGTGIVLACPWSSQRPPTLRRPLFERLGTHLAAAYRLRRALGQQPSLDVAEAVFTAAGRLEHLAVGEDWQRDRAEDRGRARPDSVTRLLIDRGRKVKTALGPIRRVSAARALSLWKGLFDGRWSLVTHSDRDGKRLLLAFRNPPGVRDDNALNTREQQVVGLLCQGCSSKQVAYELGLAPSTISGHLKAALGKLRLRNVGQLLALSGLPSQTRPVRQ
jgi:DNA-binding CsgD family transcriptional regulator